MVRYHQQERIRSLCDTSMVNDIDLVVFIDDVTGFIMTPADRIGLGRFTTIKHGLHGNHLGKTFRCQHLAIQQCSAEVYQVGGCRDKTTTRDFIGQVLLRRDAIETTIGRIESRKLSGVFCAASANVTPNRTIY